jgi:hypothetical protein
MLRNIAKTIKKAIIDSAAPPPRAPTNPIATANSSDADANQLRFKRFPETTDKHATKSKPFNQSQF